MAKRLATHVHVQDANGATHVFGPNDKLPGWAAKAITNPAAWVDEDSTPTEDEDEDEDGQEPGVPPRTGRGSGRDAWAAYAAAHDVTVEDGASRDDIIAALDAASVPTE